MRRLALAAVVLALSASPALADVGSPGPSTRGASATTGEKPQSKLWFNDGTWWGVLYNADATRYEIFRDDGGTWTPTGTEVDPRHDVHADALWDGARLHVVAATMVANDPAGAVRYSRYVYDAATRTYARDVDPVALSSAGVEAAVIDRDDSGRLWVTYTQGAQVWVTHTTGDDASWRAPYVLPGSTALDADDISTVVHLNGRIGVMWSNQNEDRVLFAAHADAEADTTWQTSVAMAGTKLADDHINVKGLGGDPAAQAIAVVKTSRTAADDPLVVLLVLAPGGGWTRHPVFTVADEPTRPQVVVDPVRRRVHVLAAMGPCCTGGTIAVKSTDLDAIAFPGGGGTPFMVSTADTHLNNPTTTKQPVDATMPSLPVLAGDDATHRLWQNRIALPAGQARPAPGAPGAPGSPGAGAPRPPGTRSGRPALIKRLTLAPRAFRRRSTIRLTLTGPGRVTFRVERRVDGRWRRLQWTRAITAKAGLTKLRFDRRLRAGRYRLVAGMRGAPGARVTFRIAR